MATSNRTANFHTDDPKAANAIVHALFTVASAQTQMPKRTRLEVKQMPASDCAFFERVKRRIHAHQVAREVV